MAQVYLAARSADLATPRPARATRKTQSRPLPPRSSTTQCTAVRASDVREHAIQGLGHGGFAGGLDEQPAAHPAAARAAPQPADRTPAAHWPIRRAGLRRDLQQAVRAEPRRAPRQDRLAAR